MQLIQKSKQTDFNLIQGISAHLQIAVFWLDLEGVVQGANESGYKLFNMGPDELLSGKTIFDLYPSPLADAIVKHNLEVMRTKEILSQEYLLESEGRVEFGFSAMKIPLLDNHGKLIGIVVSPNSMWKRYRKSAALPDSDKPQLTLPEGWNALGRPEIRPEDSSMSGSDYYLKSRHGDDQPWEFVNDTRRSE